VALTFTAVDVANGNACVLTGGQVIVVQNTDSSAHNLTVTSSSDPSLRTGDLVAAVPAGGFQALGPFPVAGWIQSDGKLWFSGDNSALQVALVTLTGW
jgi:hypothetical protein